MDSIEYTQFEEGAAWMEKQRLFRALSGPDSILLSNTELAQFYNNQLLQNTDELLAINELLVSLEDSTVFHDSVLYEARLQEIQAINNSITGSNSLELNEKLMNQFLITWCHGNFTMLNSADSQLIANMAYSCPFVNGFGVYKARMLLSAFGNPISQTDKYLCNAVGLYKSTGEGDEPQIDRNTLVDSDTDGVRIFPNPFSREITVECQGNAGGGGTFSLFDVEGRTVFQEALPANKRLLTLVFPPLSPGIYHYRIARQNGTKIFTGRLIKE